MCCYYCPESTQRVLSDVANHVPNWLCCGVIIFALVILGGDVTVKTKVVCVTLGISEIYEWWFESHFDLFLDHILKSVGLKWFSSYFDMKPFDEYRGKVLLRRWKITCARLDSVQCVNIGQARHRLEAFWECYVSQVNKQLTSFTPQLPRNVRWLP